MSTDQSQADPIPGENERLAKEIQIIRTENARIGYQTAITTWTYEGQVIWARTNIMLVANSIILAAEGFALGSQHPLVVQVVLLSIVGVVLCLIWLLTIKRAFEYQQYWILSARELEEQYLSDPVQTLSCGGDFGKGTGVPLIIGGKSQLFEISPISRIFKQKWSNYTIIAVFIIVHLIFLVQVL